MRDARDGGARAVQFVDGGLARRADVERAAGAADGREQCVDDVADVDEVAHLAAVAEDDRLVAARHPLEEDRDDPALEPGVLARAEDVGEAERDVARAVDAVPAGEVLLAALLRDAVRGERQEREALVDRAGALAVAGAARRREDHLRPRGLRGLEHVDGADDVHLGVELGALHRRLDVGLRGEVEDDVALDLERRADVVLEQTGCRVQVLALAGMRSRRRPARRRPGRSEHQRGSSR